MIVSLRLSIPDHKLDDVHYHCQRLYEMSVPGYPGFVRTDFTGLKGRVKTMYRGKPVRRDGDGATVTPVPQAQPTPTIQIRRAQPGSRPQSLTLNLEA